jgi:4-aminobutyrate--pyruvate transaminase
MADLVNSPAARDIKYVMHPYTNQEKHKEIGPLIVDGAKGVWVTDDSGNRYIEGMAGLWCTSLGFGEDRLIEAATKQMRALPYYHIFTHKTHNPAIDLAERLVNMAPAPMGQVFFANSGSEANDTAVKLIWYYNNAIGRPEKKKIISRLKGYHGVTVASASLTGLPYNHKDFDLPIANILHTECPHYYRHGQDGESEEAFATRMADSLEQMILDEGPETVAAFFAEPIMGAGGVLLPPKGYFEKIQAVLKKYDVLFVADEVICGFGRTGNMFGCETFGIQPDMMTVAKALSSAYLPISALLVNQEIVDAVSQNSSKIGTFGHGYTYSGHPAAVAVALETLDIYEERDILSHIRQVGPYLQERLREFADHPNVGEVRGTGMIGAVEFVADKETKRSFEASQGIGFRLMMAAQEHGAILRAVPGDGIAFSPPLIISKEEIDFLIDAFAKAVRDVEPMMSKQAA